MKIVHTELATTNKKFNKFSRVLQDLPEVFKDFLAKP
jgi:hypothetical protein